jgi:hypothetical protein
VNFPTQSRKVERQRLKAKFLAVIGVRTNNQMKSSFRSNVGEDANISTILHLRKPGESRAVVGVPANNQMKSSFRSNVGGTPTLAPSCVCENLRNLREIKLRFNHFHIC